MEKPMIGMQYVQLLILVLQEKIEISTNRGKSRLWVLLMYLDCMMQRLASINLILSERMEADI